jgi:uncharacterized protein (TIGR02246 family)
VNDLDRLQAHNAVVRTLVLYGHLLDDQRFQEWGELFCEDATWTFGSFHYKGRKAIVDGVCGMQPKKLGGARHTTLPPVIDFDGQEAYAWSELIAFSITPEASTVATTGRYFDILRHESDRWRFARRLVIPAGQPVPAGIRLPPAF